MAIEDHTREGVVRMYPDKRKLTAVEFLKATAAHYRELGVGVMRQITDNDPDYRPQLFARTC